MNFRNTVAALAVSSCVTAATAQCIDHPLVIGYVRGPNHTMQPGEVNPHKMNRAHYAFLYTKDGGVVVSSIDEQNLKYLVSLKNEVTSFTVLASVGGGAHSGDFSDIALTEESRAKFNASCIAAIEKYGLDGIDVDWEYPQAPRADKRYRPADKQNYTLLLRDLRKALDDASAKLHRPLYLSSATNGKQFFLRSTNMGEAAKYLDTVALMGYDIFGPSSRTTGHHSALYTNPASPAPVSDDQFVKDYVAAGVPAAKIVLGVPFYGYMWSEVDGTANGLFQPTDPSKAKDVPYRTIVSTYAKSGSGFTRYWDDKAAMPFLYNSSTGQWISYDDPESLAKKASFICEHKLGGMMFWELSGDSNDTLLDSIDKGLGIRR
ncbi:glycoside hydrolase family 18 protein [Granulicella cerasi]|uniref:chitinase n=1 Tax=Granulicella cerasi TaxID=741063 RepID=A0ABW1Z894_9BACT|nr:glycoside hydrolase family 18 protein [Granulicella cerasi]